MSKPPPLEADPGSDDDSRAPPVIEAATVQPVEPVGQAIAVIDPVQDARANCHDLAEDRNILDAFAGDLARTGFAGEERAAKLLYLAVTSRILDHPVSVAVKGPSSAGKSHLVQQVLKFFPDSAYYALTGMSERALAYSQEPLVHRFLVIYEAAGLQGELASYLLRSLLTEGRLRYVTVEGTPDGPREKVIEREGPTGLITTTTAIRLHQENETRLFSVPVTDTPEQTRRILLAQAEDQDESVDLTRWHALQVWLEGAERRVTIPFGPALADAIPPVAVRLRRDFRAVLNLIKAHALLHQWDREKDDRGRVIATLQDYEAVRELVADLLAEGLEGAVSSTIRETVDVVKRLLDAGTPDVSVLAVAHALGLDKSSASRRVNQAITGGYLQNLQEGHGRQSRLVLGAPLPEDIEILPKAETLSGCTVA